MFAPMSELYGRRLPVIFAAFAFGVFNIGVAVAKDVQTLMICRFFVSHKHMAMPSVVVKLAWSRSG